MAKREAVSLQRVRDVLPDHLRSPVPGAKGWVLGKRRSPDSRLRMGASNYQSPAYIEEVALWIATRVEGSGRSSSPEPFAA